MDECSEAAAASRTGAKVTEPGAAGRSPPGSQTRSHQSLHSPPALPQGWWTGLPQLLPEGPGTVTPQGRGLTPWPGWSSVKGTKSPCHRQPL